MIARRLKKAEDYQEINKTVAINILNFDLLDQTNRFHNVFRFKEVHTGIELTDVAEIHTMELPELRRYITDHREEVEREIGKNVLLDWLLFIDNPESELSKLITKQVPEIEGAMEMLQKLSQDDILREQYEAREKAMRDRISAEKERERRIKEAESRVKEAEGKVKEAEGKAKEAEGKAKEAEGKAKEAEGKAKEAEGKAKEAEGKAKEAEGKAKEAEEKGMEKVLWKIIQKKFPSIDSSYLEKLVELETIDLEVLSIELMDMKNIHELELFFSKNC